MIPRKREHNLQIHLSDQENGMLDQLCDHTGENRSQIVRNWIRKEWNRIFGEKEGEKNGKD